MFGAAVNFDNAQRGHGDDGEAEHEETNQSQFLGPGEGGFEDEGDGEGHYCCTEIR